jgi:enoyl-[acyl-carrier-protein] reductase (NADH)
MNRLDGKVALVSGAARGIGAETARKMAAAGATVIIGDVLADTVRQTASEISNAGGKVLALGLDVTEEAAWAAAVDEATKQFGKLDILVNNAGIFLGKDLMDATVEEWNRLVAVNMMGVWLLASPRPVADPPWSRRLLASAGSRRRLPHKNLPTSARSWTRMRCGSYRGTHSAPTALFPSGRRRMPPGGLRGSLAKNRRSSICRSESIFACLPGM